MKSAKNENLNDDKKKTCLGLHYEMAVSDVIIT